MNRRNFQKVVVAGGLGLGIRSAGGSTLAETQQRKQWEFDGLTFDNTFSGARLSELLRLGEGRYLAVSRPEVRPINPSPWYAFAIRSETARAIELVIRVDSSDDAGSPLKASRPWLSADGAASTPLSDSAWNRDGIDSVARIDLPAGRLVVSAWKPVTLESVNAWIDGIAEHSFVRQQVIGLSREGRPLRQLEIGDGAKRPCIVVLGGQHPPEITGNHGLEAFVGEICADHETAARFRHAFRTVVVPMINPDGKHHGHWRCTTGGIDPNRDWFEQSQPEVRAVARHLARTTSAGGSVRFGIDFHATNRDFVYVESPAAGDQVADFTRRWCEKAEGLPEGVKLELEPGRAMNPCSREWMAANLKCPAYTREFRYDQDEEEVRRKSRTEARAMMELLLAGEA